MAVDLIKSLGSKPEPLAKKAQKAGMDITPQTPGVVSSLGATPKQIDMASSPQAQQGELRRQSQQQQRAAQLQAQEARDVAGASDMRETASNLINTLANYQSSITAVTQADLGADVASGTARTSQDFLTAGGENIIASDGQEAMFTADTLRQESIGKLDEVIVGTEDDPSILDEALTVSMGEIKELADSITGTDPASLEQKQMYMDIYNYGKNVLKLEDNATVNDVKGAVETEINQITSIVDYQRDVLHDRNATPAERQQARQLMRDYGAAHLIATDKELDDFKQDMSTVGVMEFNGQTYSLEDLADNEAVAATILTAATSLLDDPNLKPEDVGLEDYPDLFTFVKNHSAAIESVLAEEQDNLQTVQTQVQENKLITDAMGPDLAEQLGLTPFTTDKLSDSFAGQVFSPDFDPSKYGLTQDEAKSTVLVLSQNSPDMAKTLLKSKESFEENIDDYRNRVINFNNFDNAKDLNTILAMTTEYNSSDKLQALLSDIKQFPEDYTNLDISGIDIFDANKDGKLDSFEKIQETLKARSLKGESIADLVKGLGGPKKVREDIAFITEQARGLPFSDALMDPKNVPSYIEEMTRGQTQPIWVVRGALNSFRKFYNEHIDRVPKGSSLHKNMINLLNKLSGKVDEYEKQIKRAELEKELEEKKGQLARKEYGNEGEKVFLQMGIANLERILSTS